LYYRKVKTRIHGKWHISQYADRDDAEVVYLVDPDKLVLESRVNELREKTGNSYRVQGVADVRRVLEDPQLDAISVATPNNWYSLDWPCGQSRVYRRALAQI
jgi:predicted dehydrogenase